MISTGADGLIREVVEQIVTGEDMEIHISLISTEEHPVYVEIRNYVPSTKLYGRGLLLPPGTAKLVRTALAGIIRDGLA